MFFKISLFSPKPTKQQLFIAGGSGICPVLKLLPVTCMNQLAGDRAKGYEHSHFACAEKGEQAATQQPRATDFLCFNLFLWEKKLSAWAQVKVPQIAAVLGSSMLKMSEPFPLAMITF